MEENTNKKHPLDQWLDVQRGHLSQHRIGKWLLTAEPFSVYLIESERAAPDASASTRHKMFFDKLSEILEAAKNATWSQVLRSQMARWVIEAEEGMENRHFLVEIAGVRCMCATLLEILATLPAEQLMIAKISVRKMEKQTAEEALLLRFKLAGKQGCVVLANAKGPRTVVWEDYLKASEGA